MGEQRLLFAETIDMDLAAVDEDLRGKAQTEPPRQRAARQRLPLELGALSTSMNLSRASADNVAPTGQNPRRHLRAAGRGTGTLLRPTATSVRNTAAVRAITTAPIPAAAIYSRMTTVGLLG